MFRAGLARETGEAAADGKSAELRELLGDLRTATATDGPRDGEYVAYSAAPVLPGAPKVVAFYLPQFHPIPENDAAWGEGFTEWTNVTRALPQFEGHYQPRLPGPLGFYDLRLPEIQVRQAELARAYGIEAFCYHYYWFGGRRVLNRPIEQMLANPAVDMPFCICWANEPWTRAWDGNTDDVIIPYESTPEGDARLFDDVLPLLRDPRYLRVNGMPLLIVYRPSILADAAATFAHWRARAREAGLPGLYLACTLAYKEPAPERYGVDAAIEFPPHGTSVSNQTDSHRIYEPERFGGQIVHYTEAVADGCRPRTGDAFVRIQGVFPDWDNEARRPGRGLAFAGSTPALYRQWLTHALLTAHLDPAAPKMVFVNAWNEWAEGAYLEPDRRYGYAYLEATRAAINDVARAG